MGKDMRREWRQRGPEGKAIHENGSKQVRTALIVAKIPWERG